MVDSINPSGQIQNISSSSRGQKSDGPQKTDQVNRSEVDEVQISEEALSLSQAEDTAQTLAKSIAADSSLTLSSDSDRLNSLV